MCHCNGILDAPGGEKFSSYGPTKTFRTNPRNRTEARLGSTKGDGCGKYCAPGFGRDT